MQIFSQDLTILWDKNFNDDKSNKEVINDWLLLPDGNLIGVGYKEIDKIKNGLLVKIEAETGQLVFRKTYTEAFKDMVLKSIAEAHDGSLYMVGFVEVDKGNPQGIILRTDELGKKLWEKKIGKHLNSLEKIVWKEDNTGLIVGYNKSSLIINGSHILLGGKISLTRIEGETIIEEKIIKSAYRDIIGLIVNQDNSVWIVGNTRKSKKTRKGYIYVSKYDDKGNLSITRILGGRDFQFALQAIGNYDGELVVAGRTELGTLGDGDAWIVELNADGAITLDMPLRAPKEEYASAVVKAPNGSLWVVLQTQPFNTKKNVFVHDIAVLTEGQQVKYPLQAKEIRSFFAQQLIRTYQGNFIIAGTMVGTHGSSRLLSFKNEDYLVAKSFKQLENTEPEFFFEDKNEDGCFSANERGYMEFTLKNTGSAPIFEGTINLIPTATVAGLQLSRIKQFIPHLPAGKERKVRVHVLAADNLERGESKGMMKITSQDRELLNFPYRINSISCDKVNTKNNIISFGWIKPNVVSLNSREARTVEDFFSLEVNISSPTVIKQSDPKIYKNGILLKDEKAGERSLSKPMKEGLNLNYRFKYTIRQLEEGKNTIYLQLKEARTDSIIIYYEPHKPNMHVLAIGPKHKDLKYTAKDARDFALAMKKQASNGFFNNVILDTLTTKQKTRTTPIKVAFKELRNRYHDQDRADKIYANDYLVVFISSHGIKHEGKFRLLPSDFNEKAILETTVDYKEDVIGYLNQIKCKKILFIDACLSGNIKGSKAPTYRNISSALLRANESAAGTVSYASCSENELSYEDAKWENGVFTEALLEALKGQKVQLKNGTYLAIESNSNQKDEIITIDELFQFLSIRVPDLMKNLNDNLSQTPTISNNQLEKQLPIFLLK